MNHFDAETWSDYVRGTTSESQATLMRRHLEDGCAACSGHVAALEAVKTLVEHERELGLAAGTERSVKAMFRQRQVVEAASRPASRLQLVFDSHLAPLAVGARNGQSEARQLMYMSEELSLDLHLVPATADGDARVLGEIVARDSGHLVGCPVALLDGGDVVAEGYTGDLGEFDLAGEISGRAGLRFELEETVELELPPG